MWIHAIVVGAAGFDEQHAARGIRAQTIGEQATRSASADDDVVEGRIGHAEVRAEVIDRSTRAPRQ